jgi:ubiquinone/menaquinone biosynthesis C-methylase UbiE
VSDLVANGHSLAGTGDESIDFVHAHGVFVYTPFLVTISYLKEIARVLKPDGVFVADFYTEETMTMELLDRWLDSPHQYPVVMPYGYLQEIMRISSFVQVEAFFNPHGMGRSHYLIFRKSSG